MIVQILLVLVVTEIDKNRSIVELEKVKKRIMLIPNQIILKIILRITLKNLIIPLRLSANAIVKKAWKFCHLEKKVIISFLYLLY